MGSITDDAISEDILAESVNWEIIYRYLFLDSDDTDAACDYKMESFLFSLKTCISPTPRQVLSVSSFWCGGQFRLMLQFGFSLTV